MIDAHLHLWLLDRPECTWPTAADGVLHRDYGLDEGKRAAASLSIDRAVLVQTQEDDRDTEWLLSLAADEPFVAAVVGWADLSRGDIAAHLSGLAAWPKLVGLRPMVQHRAGDWYDDPAFASGFGAMAEQGLRLDALVRPLHLPALDRLASRHPDLAIVIDHGAKPDFANLTSWAEAIAPLADRPNLCCKLSGLLTELGDAPREALAPVVARILSLFGAERVMWGSDWPVVQATVPSDEWMSLARSLVPAAQQQAVFEGAAACFYGLDQGARQ